MSSHYSHYISTDWRSDVSSSHHRSHFGSTGHWLPHTGRHRRARLNRQDTGLSSSGNESRYSDEVQATEKFLAKIEDKRRINVNTTTITNKNRLSITKNQNCLSDILESNESCSECGHASNRSTIDYIGNSTFILHSCFPDGHDSVCEFDHPVLTSPARNFIIMKYSLGKL